MIDRTGSHARATRLAIVCLKAVLLSILVPTLAARQRLFERIFGELRTWTADSATTCDITASRYDTIYVVSASGEGCVRLHPHWDVLRECPFP